MRKHRLFPPVLFALCLATIAAGLLSDAIAQSKVEKVRLGIAATSVGFLPIYAGVPEGVFQR